MVNSRIAAYGLKAERRTGRREGYRRTWPSGRRSALGVTPPGYHERGTDSALGTQDDGDGPVVYQFDLHQSAEAPGCHLHSLGPQGVAEVLI